METRSSPRARLLVELPAERYRTLRPGGRVPCIGDMLVLDQGFTGPGGSAMVLAYFPGLGSDSLYEAEVYESELERCIREYDVVKVTQLLSATREFSGTQGAMRGPRVGDIATVCHEYSPRDPTARVAVEMVNPRGETIWLADFERAELELMSTDGKE
jgi:hypothetical protein